MRELFEICPNFFFNFFGAFCDLRGGEFGEKRSKIECSNVSGATWKSPCLSPGKMTIFAHLALFFHLSFQKIWDFYPLQNYFLEKYKNRAITT